MNNRYLGKLNVNELYGFIFNMIISQQVEILRLSHNFTQLVDSAKVDGSMYGDTKLWYPYDIGHSTEWEADMEADKLLKINRNNSIYSEGITIDRFRIVDVTTDDYLSKRAWSSESAFTQFTTALVSSLQETRRLYETTLYNAFIGTTVTKAPRGVVTFDLSADLAGLTGIEKAQMKGLTIGEHMANLFIDMENLNHDFNENGYNRAYTASKAKLVWNSKHVNRIRKVDLPTVFHKDGVVDRLDEFVLPYTYFGEVNAAGGTVQKAQVGTIRATDDLVFYLSTDSAKKNPIKLFAGEALPENAVYKENETYTVKSDILCKIVYDNPAPLMSGFGVGTNFYNARSLTTNHYYIWGFNTLKVLSDRPLITVKIKEA